MRFLRSIFSLFVISYVSLTAKTSGNDYNLLLIDVIMQGCGNTMPDLPDQVLDSTGQVLFLRSACPWASEIILLVSGHSLQVNELS